MKEVKLKLNKAQIVLLINILSGLGEYLGEFMSKSSQASLQDIINQLMSNNN